jgi:hypothetical protein
MSVFMVSFVSPSHSSVTGINGRGEPEASTVQGRAFFEVNLIVARKASSLFLFLDCYSPVS